MTKANKNVAETTATDVANLGTSVDKKVKKIEGAAKIKELIANSPRTRYKIARTSQKPFCKVILKPMKGSKAKSQSVISYGEPLRVCLNGYVFHVPRGVRCDIPEYIADFLDQMDDRETAFSQQVEGMIDLSFLEN